MHFDEARAPVKETIRQALAGVGLEPNAMQGQVYQQMMALCMELMVERQIIEEHPAHDAGGDSDPSYWRAYVTSLPEPPDTMNLYSELDKLLYTTLLEQDLGQMYAGLVEVIATALTHLAKRMPGTFRAPPRKAVEDEFFFILSRLSYLRLIPYIDLANAALPGEHNVKIHQVRTLVVQLIVRARVSSVSALDACVCWCVRVFACKHTPVGTCMRGA